MINLMAHLYEGNRNFNHMMNKREIERKITSENFLQILTKLEESRKRCFSYSAFSDHLNACIEPRGWNATTSMWGFVTGETNAKQSMSTA